MRPVACGCHWCITEQPHPARHADWEGGSRLLVAESLNPADRQKTVTCRTCGHTQDV